MDREINVSVRGMVEFVLRSGSIDSGYMQKSRMQDGIRVHQKIQKIRKREAERDGAEYDAEARLKLSFEYKGFNFTVLGIADGIRRGGPDGGVSIDEIKSTVQDVAGITEDESHWHMAQAKCYGHMYCELYGAEDVTINLIYAAVETDETRIFSHTFSYGELKAFFFDITERYFKWAEFEYDHKQKRDESIKKCGFPYEKYRRGQREFAILAYRAIQNNTKLFIEAPTGTGKTISALFPAVKSLAEGLSTKIFYLTAKTTTRQAAEAAVGLMNDKGYMLSYVVLTAKDKICFLPERACSSSLCPYADGHFDRVNDALWDLITSSSKITRANIESCAREHCVCPHEFMLDVSLFTDVVICDYNYAFDPTASLKRFFGENAPHAGKFTLLVDEAHNLVERAREMFSASLWKSDFSDARKALRASSSKKTGGQDGGATLARRSAKSLDSVIKKTLDKINKAIREVGTLVQDGKEAAVTDERPFVLRLLLDELSAQTDKWLAENQFSDDFGIFLELYFKVLDFLRVWDIFNEKYTVYIEKNKTDTGISLLCLDPSENLAATLKRAVGSVFFSATLTPLEYFKNVLGGDASDKTARLPSPFDAENYCVVVENRISTKYKDRGSAGYEKTADALYAMASAKKGNYFAFFSSYEYLKNVHGIFTEKYPEITTMIQEQNMSEDMREGFLSAFSDEDGALLAFAVMGGVFSEGIDLVGDKLIGAAVVGVGLPLISCRRDALKDYYESVMSSGFEYAYMYPGMNKVLQAAGRVVRTETDRGVILLIDDRFTSARYTELFPHEWQLFTKPSNARSLEDIFRGFWAAEGLETESKKQQTHENRTSV